MTDLEFDILDELYFVQSFDYLEKALDMDEQTLKDNLDGLVEKGWVKCFLNHTEEVFKEDVNIDKYYRQYSYLATKQGLLAHNADG